MPETTQKLLVAMLRIKKTGSLLEELCARLKTRKEKRTTEVFVSLPKRQDLSAEKNRINIVKSLFLHLRGAIIHLINQITWSL